MKTSTFSARRKSRPAEQISALPIEARIHWRDRPFLTMEVAAELLGCSRAKIYNLATLPMAAIKLVSLGGRTLAETASIVAHLDTARPFVPTGTDRRGAALARARRIAREQASGLPPA